MTKTKSTKHALLTSFVTLLLCVTMLIGSTFAWFTDEVSTSGNKIQSGTLKIDLVDDNNSTLVDKVINFAAADGRAQDEILWEPGCTYETQKVYVVNKGNLALKYKIVINGIDGDVKLLEAIDWKVTVDGVVTDLTTFVGHLTPGQKSGAIVLSGHMKEEAGNEYQNLTAEGISITVVAAQDTVEYDSFSYQYDANALYENIGYIYNMIDLRTAAAKGGKYLLADNISMSADEAVIPVKADFVLNTNDYTLDFSAFDSSADKDNNRPFTIDEGVSFTINAGEDSIIAGNLGFVNIKNASTLIVNGGKFSGAVASGKTGALIKVSSAGATTVQLNNVDYTTTAKAIVIESSAYSGAAEDLNITVNGGNYSTGYAPFYLNGNSNTTIKNATITAGNVNSTESTVGVYVLSGTGVKIDNCQITSNGTGKDSGGVLIANGGLLTVTDSNIDATCPYALRVYSSGGTISIYNTTYNKTSYISGKTHGADAVIIKDGKEIYRKTAS